MRTHRILSIVRTSMYVRAAVVFGFFVSDAVRSLGRRIARCGPSVVPTSVRRAGERTFQRPRGLAVAVPLIVGMWALTQLLPARAIPVPDLIYQIESVSNGHRASCSICRSGSRARRRLRSPSTSTANKVPDVLVSVNLVNTEGSSTTRPIRADPRAEHRDRARAERHPARRKPSPPLRINVKMRMRDRAAQRRSRR